MEVYNNYLFLFTVAYILCARQGQVIGWFGPLPAQVITGVLGEYRLDASTSLVCGPELFVRGMHTRGRQVVAQVFRVNSLNN